jgi:hypothetical protein
MSSTAAPAMETLTPAETAKILKVSESWLAKARGRGDGPPSCGSGDPSATHRSRCSTG